MSLPVWKTIGVLAVYALAVLAVILQFGMIIGDPAVPDYNSAAVQAQIEANGRLVWTGISVLIIAIVALTVFLFKGKRTAGWVAVPGLVASLAIPGLFVGFRILGFAHALNS
jgi:hypothetical protein